MNKREDYEVLKNEVDGSRYWFARSDVKYAGFARKLQDFANWFNANEVNNGIYYKGTRLYFTFEGEKYYVSWTFYDKEHLQKGIDRLKALGAGNIQINYGELD